jgi:hypothetical protein
MNNKLNDEFVFVHEAIIILKQIKQTLIDKKKEIIKRIPDPVQSILNNGFKELHNISSYDYDKQIVESIDWKAVKKLLNPLLTIDNLIKIKNCNNDELKAEFIIWAKWMDKNIPKSAVIKEYNKIPSPKQSFSIISSSITNTDNKPLYTKYISDITINLKIKVHIEKTLILFVDVSKRDPIDHEYGRLRINSSHPSWRQSIINQLKNRELEKISYRKDTYLLSKDLKLLNIEVWRHNEKYKTPPGTYYIKIYDVELNLLHFEEFLVKQAPSEKFEIDLKEAEIKLQTIKEFQYFKSELNKLNIELNIIKEWQFFRRQTLKKIQIEEKQKQINLVLLEAENERKKDIENQEAIITEIKKNLNKAEY